MFSIAIAHGHLETGSLANQGIDYWALGGEHNRQVATARYDWRRVMDRLEDVYAEALAAREPRSRY